MKCPTCGYEPVLRELQVDSETCPKCGNSLSKKAPAISVSLPEPVLVSKPKRKFLSIGSPVLLILFVLIVYTQLSIFVVPPIGAVPEGRTLIITRLKNSAFIDSADSFCERTLGGVSLLCRGIVLGSVARNSKIIVRLPYIDWLYLISTGGRRYEK